MTAVGLAVPLDLEERLVRDAPRHGHSVVARCSGADELAGRLPIDRPELVVAHATPQYLGARLVGTCDALGVRLIVLAQDPVERRHARSVGIADPVAEPFGWELLDPAVPGLPADPWADRGPIAAVPSSASAAAMPADIAAMLGDDPPHPADASPETPVAARGRTGTVIAVWGSGGAPGRTSVAIALAAELAEAGLSVALGDADTHAASVAPALGLLDEAPGFAAACRLAGGDALTDGEFERIAEWKRVGHAGFWVLTGIGRPSRWPELTAQRVTATIQAARRWVDVLVLDLAAPIEQDEELSSDLLAPRRNQATLAALRSADRIVTVGAADPVGLARFLRATAELVDVGGTEQVVPVINKVRSSAVGLNPSAQITQTLVRFGGIEDAVLVPWDPASFDAAVLSGRALLDVAPRSAARSVIRSLAIERLRIPGAARLPTARRFRRAG